MIEAGSDKLASIRSVNGEMQWSLLLRPHGSGGFTRFLPDLGEGTLHIWTNKYRAGIWRTRAQAALAVYEGGR